MRRIGAAAVVGMLAITGVVVGAGPAGASTTARMVVRGTVTAIGGASAAGTCGSAGAVGTVTVTATSNATPPVVTTTDVAVVATTAFVNHKVASPSFADLCVGDTAVVIGTVAAGVTTAAAVAFHVPKPSKPVHATGRILTVDGSPITGTCGTAGASGTVVLAITTAGVTVEQTVAVSASTVFIDHALHAPTYADVCVGDKGKAVGPVVGGVVEAIALEFHAPAPPKPLHASGTVSAVGGVTTPGTCGTAGAAGAFSLTYTDSHTVPPSLVTRTVDVVPSTTVVRSGGVAGSFADVCVGDRATVIGTDATGTIGALAIAVRPPKA